MVLASTQLLVATFVVVCWTGVYDTVSVNAVRSVPQNADLLTVYFRRV